MKFELAEDGSFKRSSQGHSSDGTWRIEYGEVILIDSTGEGVVLKIESNGNLTAIAMMEGGERKAPPAGEKFILTRGEARTETNTAAAPTALTAAERKVVGEYYNEIAEGGFSFLSDRKIIISGGGEQISNNLIRWKISDQGELHVEIGRSITVYRINPDDSITVIAEIRDGKRKKVFNVTYKKVK